MFLSVQLLVKVEITLYLLARTFKRVLLIFRFYNKKGPKKKNSFERRVYESVDDSSYLMLKKTGNRSRKLKVNIEKIYEINEVNLFKHFEMGRLCVGYQLF